MKKKVCAVLLGTALTCHVPLVYGEVQDYQAVTEADKEDNKIFQAFSTEDGSGNTYADISYFAATCSTSLR